MGLFILIVIVIVGLHVGWYIVSRRKLYADLPDVATIRSFQDRMLRRMNIDIDPEAIEETFLKTEGPRLHINILAAGEGAPVLVFVPGTSVYAWLYVEFMYAMYRQGFTVIGFDPRGHGQSSGARGDYTMNELVEDTLAVVDYARKRFGGPVAVAGSSQGGMVAFYAAAADESLAAAVCHNLADLNGKDNLQLSRLKIPAPLVPVNQLLIKLYGRFAIPVSLYLDLSREFLKDGTDAATYVRQDPLCINWVTLRALGSLMKTQPARPVEAISVPVMLVHSGQDNIFPQTYVEGIYHRLTCPKEYLLLENRDHLVMTNHVEEVAEPVAEWLKQIMTVS